MPPGQQVNPVDQWVGTAGRKLAQYESRARGAGRLNKDRQAFEAKTMQRFADLEQRLTSASRRPRTPPAPAAAPARAGSTVAAAMPPASLPPPPSGRGHARRAPGDAARCRAVPLSPGAAALPAHPPEPPRSAGRHGPAAARRAPTAGEFARTVSTFLPVSFTRGVLLGGLDAPTGGQSQSNPHPVLIRLSDNSVLPNRFRGEYRECFVIAAGYGDISSERAYLRTENLSCVRADGATLEVRIQGSVYGEDGKVGMRGRLVTKQGQMLANALLAGVVSGIGQGLATANTTYSTSALGTIASASGCRRLPRGPGHRRRQGAGPAGPVLHQAGREHLSGHRGGRRPRDRRRDHQGRAHRRADDRRAEQRARAIPFNHPLPGGHSMMATTDPVHCAAASAVAAHATHASRCSRWLVAP
jgi:conjugal transfer pilus assembly protein TraB